MQKYTKKITADAKYLAFPVTPRGDGEGHSFASLLENGELIYEFFLDLDFENPAFWSFCDMERFNGKELELLVESDSITDADFETLKCADTYPGKENVYHENGRPQLHFSPERGYISDPNGLFYYNRKYHIFFQHDIFNLGWTDWQDHVNMAWGHAVSTDLVHWSETPDVLLPDNLGPAFSGSGVVDINNISGLQKGEHPPILLYYTSAGGQGRHTRHLTHVQCLALSLDGGETFEKYKNNPIIPNRMPGNRDPKVFYNKNLGLWQLFIFTDDGEQYLMYTSKDLLHFDYVSNIVWDNRECPDLLELPVNGDKGNKKTVLWGANGSYMVVEFDGKNITPISPSKKLQSNFLHTCAQTFNNAPDERCIQMSVFRMGPGKVSGGCLSVPCDITLHEKDGDYWLISSPCPEIEKLRCDTAVFNDLVQDGFKSFPADALMDIEIEMPICDCSFNFNGLEISIDASKKTLNVEESVTPLCYSDSLSLRILVDTVCVQIWEPKNRVSLEFGYGFETPRVEVKGDYNIKSLKIHKLESIW